MTFYGPITAAVLDGAALLEPSVVTPMKYVQKSLRAQAAGSDNAGVTGIKSLSVQRRG